MNNQTPSGWKRNLNYVLTQFSILLKKNTEYKANLYMALINNFGLLTSEIIFLSVLYSNFSEIINWQYHEFVFYIIIMNFMTRISGTFWFAMRLRNQLIKGTLNTYLTKPINIFTQYIFNTLAIQASLVSLIYAIALIVYLIYYYQIIDIARLTLLIPFLTLAGFFTVIILRYFDSIAFFIKQNQFITQIYTSMNQLVKNYPIIIFDNFINKIGYILGMAYFGAYSTQFLFGHMDYTEFFNLNLILIILTIILSTLLYTNWKIGLKKYEAFG